MIITVLLPMEVETQTLTRVIRGLGSELPTATVSSTVEKSVSFRCDEKKTTAATLHPLKISGRGNASTDRGGTEVIPSAKSRHYSFSQDDLYAQSNVHRRRYSDRFTPNTEAFQFKRKYNNRPGGGKGKIVRLTKFLLGGTINDPLNLGSLADDEVNKRLNAPTPVASPAPAPVPYPDPPIAVFRPKNVNDPLNLSACDPFVPGLSGMQSIGTVPLAPGGRHKKRRHFKKKSVQAEANEGTGEEQPARVEKVRNSNDPLFIDVDVKSNTAALADGGTALRDCRRSSALDKIVSPAIPQMSPRRRKRRRTSSEGRPDGLGSAKRVIIDVDGHPEVLNISTSIVATEKGQTVSSAAQTLTPTANETKSIGRKFNKEMFKYGNYNAYYGHRRVGVPEFEDARLQYLPIGLFDGKDVLDIGCNVGHVTLKIARDNMPRMIVGLDIDGKLIAAAKKNIRYCMSNMELGVQPDSNSAYIEACAKKSSDRVRRLRSDDAPVGTFHGGMKDKRLHTVAQTHGIARANAVEQNIEPLPFSASMALMFGPVASHAIINRDIDRPFGMGSGRGSFPHNIMFQTGNYVPESEDVLLRQDPEYDVILALCVTKWIHLNNGDLGLTRAFRRMYKQLRPGGRLVLEAQEWSSYRNKKKLTEEIFKVYQSITFRPAQFRDYLLSPEVGFASCEVISIPGNKSKGCQRTILVFTKR